MDELRGILHTKDGQLNKIVQDTSFLKHWKALEDMREKHIRK